MPDVFVSYAREDRDRVEPLVAALEQHGWDVWWDRRIDAGMTFDREIESALDAARCVVVVWSPRSVDSDWVRAEASEGLERGALVPFLIEDARPPLAFRRTQAVTQDDVRGGYGPLIDAVERFVSSRRASPPRAGPDERIAVGNLPTFLPDFVGRETELESLRAVVERNRMTTVVGPGGTGKTRLALKTAEMIAGDFPGGVWLVELGDQHQPLEVAGAIARAVGIAPEPGTNLVDLVVDALRYRPSLLVLDNCEHAAEPSAALAEELLKSCRELKVLATSREPLRAVGERVFPLGPMSTDARDGHDSDAMVFFLDRARSEGAAPQRLDTARAPIEELCRRLDGLPLAIELAAARVRSVDPQQLISLLHQRFRVLESGHRTVNPHHHTLRSAIDWSYDVLDERQRALFGCLSVFCGPFELDDAVAIVSDAADAVSTLNELSELVDKSMVSTVTTGPQGYRLLETLRAYGAERLAGQVDADDVRRRHAEHFAAKAEAVRAEIVRPRHVSAVDMLVDQVGEYRSASTWACERGDLDLAVRIVAGYCGASYFRVGYDALDWLPESVRDPDCGAASTELLGLLARRAVFSGDVDRGRDLAERAISKDEGPASVQARAQLALISADPSTAVDWARSATDLATGAGDDLGVLLGLLIEGGAHARTGSVDEAVAVGDRLTALGDSRGSDHARGWGQVVLGGAFRRGNPELASEHFAEALRLGRAEKNRYLQSNALVGQVSTSLAHEDPAAAAGMARATLIEFRDTVDGGYFFVRRALSQVVVFLARFGMKESCVLDGYQGSFGRTTAPRPLDAHAEIVARLKDSFGADEVERLRQSGARLGADEAIDTAVAALDRLA